MEKSFQENCLSNSATSSKSDLTSDLIFSSRLGALKDLQTRNYSINRESEESR